jgi:hypothetical protein
MQNVEEDLRLGRSDSAGTDLRKILEYILKEYYLACGNAPGQASISDMLGELKKNKFFDPVQHSDNHLTWKDKSFFYDIKNLGNGESHFDPTRPDQGRPSVAKATAAYEDLQLFLPRFLEDVPVMLTAPQGKRAPAAPVRPAPIVIKSKSPAAREWREQSSSAAAHGSREEILQHLYKHYTKDIFEATYALNIAMRSCAELDDMDRATLARILDKVQENESGSLK